MGREKKNERRGHFARLDRHMMEMPAWLALSSNAKALFPYLLLEWRGPDANNNGKIRFSVRQAEVVLQVTKDTAAKAFHDLQAKGFIVVTEHARLGVSGMAKGPSYEITTIQLPQASARGGRRLFAEWQTDADFPVHRARANNPLGSNGKPRSHHKNEDSNVIKIGKNRE